MAERLRARSIVLFFLKFAVLAPLCLVGWLYVLPFYAAFLGQGAGVPLKFAFGEPIAAVRALPAGMLNWSTGLRFTMTNGAQSTLPISWLVINVAPFVALILATPRLSLVRRAVALCAGAFILVAGHIIYLVLAFKFRGSVGSSSQIPMGLAQFFITLPFLLWILLAYWHRVTALFNEKE